MGIPEGLSAMRAAAPLQDGVCIVLCGPRNPLNIGAAARAMSNFGFCDLRLVSPYAVAFREAKSAVGASAVLAAAREFESLAAAAADCTLIVGTASLGGRKPQHAAHRLEEAAPLVRAAAAEGKAAIVFGSEKFGLSNEEMSLCHWLLRIPTREEHLSMNLGQAVAVCLYEFIRDPEARAGCAGERHKATGEQLRILEERLWEAMQRSGYVNQRVAASTRQKMHRLVKRAGFTRRDAEVWLGVFRQILWKMGAPAKGTETTPGGREVE